LAQMDSRFFIAGRWLCVCLLAPGLLDPGAVAAENRPPVPIRTPAPETPIETAGTGRAPEVAVRVTVAADGRAQDVQVLSVRPSDEFDALFERATKQTLSEWHYAPRLIDGQPAEATLSFTIQFQPRENGRGDAPAERTWSFSRRESQAADLHRKLLSMQLEQRARHLELQASTALGLMNADDVHKVNSERFVVYTDAPSEDVARITAGNLESVFNILQGLLGARVPPYPEPYRVIVFLYASRPEFEALRNRMVGYEWATGFYYPAGLLAFHMQMPSSEALVGTLLHEGTHAFLDRYVSRPGVVIPRWMHEGLAEYIGNSRIQKGKLVPGRQRKLEVYRGPGFAVTGRSAPQMSAEGLKAVMKKGQAIPLSELVTADADAFYGERAETFYAEAWLFVHFLRHGDESWADERFPSLVLYLAEGHPSEPALEEVYGDPAELEAAFQEYVRRF